MNNTSSAGRVGTGRGGRGGLAVLAPGTGIRTGGGGMVGAGVFGGGGLSSIFGFLTLSDFEDFSELAGDVLRFFPLGVSDGVLESLGRFSPLSPLSLILFLLSDFIFASGRGELGVENSDLVYCH